MRGCILPINAYVAQATRVRPYDGVVLCWAASQAYLAGDSAKWLELAKRAFHCGRRSQQQLVTDLIGHTANENIPTMIDFIVREFQPDREGLQWIHQVCAKRCSTEWLTPLIRYRASWAEYDASHAEPAKAAPILV